VEIVDKIRGLVQTKQASSCFINGSPGSGKSYLLNSLSQQLPEQIVGLINVLGPYVIVKADTVWDARPLVQSLYRQGYLNATPDECQFTDIASVWQWLGEKCELSQRQTFIVLIDLPHLDKNNPAPYANLLSSIRSLEASWRHNRIKLCHIVTGFWDSETIQQYVQQTGLSFPYTSGDNYFSWHGVSTAELSSAIKDWAVYTKYPIMESVLFELTGGNPYVAQQIVKQLPDMVLNFSSLIVATKETARQRADLLTTLTQYFDPKILLLLHELLMNQYLPAEQYAVHRQRLLASGLVKEEQLDNKSYLRFRSWFYEMLIRLNAEAVGIPPIHITNIRIQEMAPTLYSLNQELYRLINDIESQARNFVVIQQSLRKEQNEPLLQGLSKELKNGMSIIDAQQKANDWKQRVKNHQSVLSELNPTVCYLSTRDLANIITELASSYGMPEWRVIGDSIREMGVIRDAVMHHQIVDDSAIDHLYQLQFQIYNALAQSKEGNIA
jgi:hypothetical protein